jgi:hypothetical protein
VLCRRRQLELEEHDHLEARRKRRELGEDRHALDELVRVQALLVDGPPALLEAAERHVPRAPLLLLVDLELAVLDDCLEQVVGGLCLQ